MRCDQRLVVASLVAALFFLTVTCKDRGRDEKTGITYQNGFSVVPFYHQGRLEADSSVVIVTHCSIDRLGYLSVLSRLWSGRISAAVLVTSGPFSLPLLENVDVHVVRPPSDAAAMNFLQSYPGNFLRNIAIDFAHIGTVSDGCDAVVHVDIDIVPGADFETSMRAIAAYQHILRDRSVLVLPVFEIRSLEWFTGRLDVLNRIDDVVDDLNEFRRTKEDLYRSAEDELVFPFYYSILPRGQKAVNYSHWFRSSSPYEISYEPVFEPYFAFCSRGTPRFDERFVGRGFNKMSHAFHLNHISFRFVVIPELWLLHIGPPHFPYGTENTEQNRRMLQVYATFKAELHRDSSRSVVRSAPREVWENEIEKLPDTDGSSSRWKWVWTGMGSIFSVCVLMAGFVLLRQYRSKSPQKND